MPKLTRRDIGPALAGAAILGSSAGPTEAAAAAEPLPIELANMHGVLAELTKRYQLYQQCAADPHVQRLAGNLVRHCADAMTMELDWLRHALIQQATHAEAVKER